MHNLDSTIRWAAQAAGQEILIGFTFFVAVWLILAASRRLKGGTYILLLAVLAVISYFVFTQKISSWEAVRWLFW